MAPLVLVLFSGVLALSIYQYRSSTVGYDKLEQREYTFVKYEVTKGRRGGTIKIYVKEESLPLYGCPNFARKAVDENILKLASEGDKLIVWVSPRSSSTTYSCDVHEGKINDEYFMQLENYRKYSTKNDIFGIVICSVMLVIGFAVVGYYLIVKK